MLQKCVGLNLAYTKLNKLHLNISKTGALKY